MTRFMCILLAGSLFFAVLPEPVMAQTVSAGTSSSSSSDDSNSEYVIGFAIVAVALLLILGFRSDLEKYRESRTQAGLNEYAQAPELFEEDFFGVRRVDAALVMTGEQ